jgi:hypothetical protein
MNGWHPAKPPWETQEQPKLPAEHTWYGELEGPRVVIKPHESLPRGGRPAHDAEPGRQGRGKVLTWAIVGLAAAGGIVFGAVELTHVTGGQTPAPAAALGSTTAPVDSAAPVDSVAATTAAPAPTPTAATTVSGYVLAAPATAGGYTLKSPTSATVKAIGTAGVSELMTAVEAAGGQPSGNVVTGQYLILGDQYLGYAGYNGTFSPATVLAAFKMGASNVTTEAAGPHGGVLGCGEVSVTSPAATSGTACVWATSTTIGMVEFYGNGGSALETVLHTKASADTMKFRAGVEATK